MNGRRHGRAARALRATSSSTARARPSPRETRPGAIRTVRLSAHLCNEFLCKKDYLKNWDIEIHEEYGALTVDEWRAALARNFFEVRTITTYVNPWILQNRYQGHVNVTELNGTSFWPATNAVIIGERR